MVISAWLGVEETQLARVLAETTILVARKTQHGMLENVYSLRDGVGPYPHVHPALGHRDFGWSSAVLMLWQS